jgi:AraC-like DNA-binding protein
MQLQETYYVVSNPYTEDKDLHILFAGHSQTLQGHQVGPKVFDYYLIHHILSGKGVYTCGNRTFELSKGDSFVIEPGMLVGYTADHKDPWNYCWIAVKGSRTKELLNHVGMDWSSPVIHTHNNNNLGKWFDKIQSTFKIRKKGGGIRANGYIYMLLSDFQEVLQPEVLMEMEAQSKIERHVKQVAQQLTIQYAEPISIEDLAASYGYNRAYFSQMFKTYNHVTPVTFLLNLRIGKARQLLRERLELTIEQIAYSVGFNDPLYFSKQFKRFYKISPSQYRKSVEHLKRS